MKKVGKKPELSQKKMDELKHTGVWMEAIFEGSRDAIFISDLHSNFIMVNQAACLLTAYSKKELLEMKIPDLHEPMDLKAYSLFHNRIMDGEKLLTEAKILKKDGKKVDVEFNNTRINLEGNYYMLTTARDVSENKQVVTQIKMLSSVVEQSTEGMAITDLDANLTFVNTAWCSMHGYNDPGELLGKNLAVSHSQEQLENEVKLFNEKVFKLGSYRGEVGHITRDGKPFLTSMTTTLLKDQDGKPYAIAGIARDITERKQTEERLKESEERLNLFFGQSLDGFFFMMLDEPIVWNDTIDKEKALDYVFKHQRITKVNKAILEQYGATEEQYLGLTSADFFAHNLKQARKVMKDFFDKGHLHVDTHEKKFDGTDMIIEGDYICLYDTQKRITGHFGIQREVTEARNTMEMLQKSRSELQEYFENDISANYIVSVEGEIFSCNKTFLNMFGFEAKSHIEKFDITNLYKNPNDRKELLRKIKVDGKVENYEVDFITRDGNNINAIINAIGIYNDLGKLTQIRGYIVDITKQKQAQEKLQISENRYKRLVEKGNIAIGIDDANGKPVYFNNQFLKLFGYKAEEIANMTNKLFVHPDDFERISEIQRKRVQGLEAPTRYEFKGLKKDGSVIYVEIDVSEVFENDGKFSGTLSYLWDITERKNAEKEILVLAHSLKSINECVSITDDQNIIQFINESFLKTYGYQEHELIGKNISIVQSQQNQQPDIAKRILQGTLSNGWQGELMNKRKNGSEFPVHLSTTTIKDKEGNILGLVGVASDITERKQVEDALKKSESIYRNLIEKMPDGVYKTTHDGKVIDLNPALLRMLGYSNKEELLGLAIRDELYFDPSEREQMTIEGLNKELISYRLRKKDGSVVWVEDHGWYSYNESGKIIFHEGVLRDITERKQAENNLIIRNKLNFLKAKVWEAVSNKSTNEADLINLMLEEAGNVLNISRAAFLQLDEKKKSFVTKYQWYRPEAGSTKKVEIPAKYVKSYANQDSVQIPLQLSKFTRIFASPVLKLYHIKSWLAVPFGNKQNPSGLFTFTDCDKEREWIDFEIEILIELSKILESFTVQREADKALHENEKKYRVLFKNHPKPMWIYDVDSLKFLEVNEAAILNYGYTKQEFLAMSLKDIRPQEDIPILLNNINTSDELYQRGKNFRHKKKDGTIIQVEISSHETHFLNNKNHRMVMAIDITDQYNAEKELLKLSHAMEQSPVSIIITDTNGNIEYVNPKVAEITGYKPEELIDKNPRIFKTGEKPKSEYQYLWNTISSGKEWFGEFLNKKKNGELFWEYASISPILNKNGKITNYVAVKEDISERKRLENTQEIMHNISNAVLSNYSLETFFRNIYNELVKVIDTKNFFIGLYDEQTQMISTPFISDSIDEEITVFPAKETFTGYVIQTKKPHLINKKHFDELIEKGEVKLIGPSSEVWIGVPLFSEDKVIGVIVIQNYVGEKMLDEQDLKVLEFAAPQISLAIERKKAIDNIKAALEKAQESDRLKSAFLANMSHEIRTPMNGILGFAELLKEPDLTGNEQQKYISIIEKSGNRMLNIINDIINISKIESGQMIVSVSDTNINTHIQEIYNFFKPEADKKGIEFSFKNNLTDEQAILKTDSEKVYAILTNLVKNAIKFTDKGSIEFGVSTSSTTGAVTELAEVEFYVKDTGIGIAKEKQKAIFERFIQADIEDKMARQGAGLGLAISKAYVEMLGGRIWLESEEGTGTTFYFTIPNTSE